VPPLKKPFPVLSMRATFEPPLRKMAMLPVLPLWSVNREEPPFPVQSP
jgi:hypothetical protein